MQEKIASLLLDNWIEIPFDDGFSLADQILSLPVEGCGCTLGELPERARKMREAIAAYQSGAFPAETALSIINDAIKGN